MILIRKNNIFKIKLRIPRVLILALIFSFYFSLYISAQLIETKITEPSTTDLKFNPALIKASKIKMITLNISNKPDLQMIDDKGLVQCYEFDSTGLLKRFYSTSISHQEKIETEIKPVYYR